MFIILHCNILYHIILYNTILLLNVKRYVFKDIDQHSKLYNQRSASYVQHYSYNYLWHMNNVICSMIYVRCTLYERITTYYVQCYMCNVQRYTSNVIHSTFYVLCSKLYVLRSTFNVMRSMICHLRYTFNVIRLVFYFLRSTFNALYSMCSVQRFTS